MIKLYRKYKEIILYLFWGGCTTFVNIFAYYICTRLTNINTIAATVIAWCLSVLFAYVTNKIFVFESKSYKLKAIFFEFISFMGCRLLSGFIDLAIMYIFVNIIGMDDMIIKIISNLFVIIFNYFASKLIIFRNSIYDSI